MRILTADQIREAENLGILGIILMENAAIQTVESLKTVFPNLSKRRVGIVAGKGNNGGDGFAVSRHLTNLGTRTAVYLLTAKEDLSGDARTNLDIALKMRIPVHEIPDIPELLKLTREIRHQDIIIDAILGTGTNKPVKGFFSEVISFLNDTNSFMLSIDIPSGLQADSGSIPGNHIKADMTVALQSPKICHYQYPAAASSGKIVVCDIGIPSSVIEKEEHNIHLITKKRVQNLLHSRNPDAHKGTCGHILCISGSTGKGGAAALAGMAAYRAGAGLVTLLVPSSLCNAFEVGIPELMSCPLPETAEGTISENAYQTIMELSKGKEALLLGPGLTTHGSTSSLVQKLVATLKIPLVLDADALNIVASDMSVFKDRKHDTILTPHPGEMARLCGVQTKQIQEKRVHYAKKLSKATNTTVVLKGANTVIATDSLFINTT
ncbi:MAG: NAD(P)H-hydrate epimerase [Nitrospinota bacterium]